MTSRIDDDELRDIYRLSSAEQIQAIEAGLLRIEQQQATDDDFDELLRVAHTLKGDSRMLGLSDIEKLVHQVEYVLQQLHRGAIALSPALSAALYAALDATEALAQEATDGDRPSGVNAFAVLATLMQVSNDDQGNGTGHSDPKGQGDRADPGHLRDRGAATQPTPAEPVLIPQEDPTPIAIAPTATETWPAIPPEFSVPDNRPNPDPGHHDPYRIDTIRISTRHLDGLVDRVGELAAIERRIAHQVTLLEGVANTWDGDRDRPNFDGAALARTFRDLCRVARDDTSHLERVADDLKERTRALRLLPLSIAFQRFPRMVRDLATEQGKQVTLVVEGGDVVADKQAIEALRDPLLHLIRNAIDHGIESPAERQAQGKSPCGTIRLCGRQQGDRAIVEVIDDGRGLDRAAITATALRQQLYPAEVLANWSDEQIFDLIFLPGFSTRQWATELSGRGVGLDAVRTCAERLKGDVSVQSRPGAGCTIALAIGTTLSATQALLVEVRQRLFAIPLEFVRETRQVTLQDGCSINGRSTLLLDGEPTAAADLGDLLELPGLPISQGLDQVHPCVVLSVGRDRLSLLIDRPIDVQEIVLKPQSKLLVSVRNVIGATILGNGDVCPVLSPPDLLATVRSRAGRSQGPASPMGVVQRPPTVLLVEDSIATRTQEKRILETAGYDVVTAIDGLDALGKLRSRTFDALVSDVQMPRLDGLALTERIRQMPGYDELPIILVTSLNSEADRQRGAAAGANAYLTKDAFDQSTLLSVLRELARSP